mmetsp:Transcript_42249/g.127661  ORF Transcript_42249/g.127661 Transcript_42249/m.127661 type:complete len:212 (+) Transcript_42249:1267-1902(+)
MRHAIPRWFAVEVMKSAERINVPVETFEYDLYAVACLPQLVQLLADGLVKLRASAALQAMAWEWPTCRKKRTMRTRVVVPRSHDHRAFLSELLHHFDNAGHGFRAFGHSEAAPVFVEIVGGNEVILHVHHNQRVFRVDFQIDRVIHQELPPTARQRQLPVLVEEGRGAAARRPGEAGARQRGGRRLHRPARGPGAEGPRRRRSQRGARALP